MGMVLDREVLLRRLSHLDMGLKLYSFLGQDDLVIFDGPGDKIRCSRTSCWIEKDCADFAFDFDFSFNLDRKFLMGILRKFKEKQIKMTVSITDEQVCVVIQGKGRKVELTGLIVDDDNSSAFIFPKIDEFMDFPDGLLEAIRKSEFCLPVDNTVKNSVLGCVSVRDGDVIASDSKKLVRVAFDGEINNRFMIPGELVKDLLKFVPEKYVYRENEGGFEICFLSEDKTKFWCVMSYESKGYPSDDSLGSLLTDVAENGEAVVKISASKSMLSKIDLLKEMSLGEELATLLKLTKNNVLELKNEGDKGRAAAREKVKVEGDSLILEKGLMVDTNFFYEGLGVSGGRVLLIGNRFLFINKKDGICFVFLGKR